MEAVGIVGAGIMGLTAGRKFIESGRRVIVFDTAPRAQGKARQAGMEVVASPAVVAGLCRIALMFLPGPAQITECVTGPTGLLQTAPSGAIIVDLSTVDPATTARIGRQRSMSSASPPTGNAHLPTLEGRPKTGAST